MDSLILKIMGVALTIVTIAAFWKVVSAYLHGTDIQKEAKNFLIVMLVLAAIPFLSKAAPTIGENLVQPAVNLLVDVSETVSSDIKVD